MKVTVGGLKGGIGKTTSAVFLATALSRLDRRVLLVDADPQSQSAFDWAGLAHERGYVLPYVIQPWATPNLAQRLRQVEHEYDDIVIDTGGETASMFRSAVAFAPELVIPVRANEIELRRVPATLETAGEVQDVIGKPVYARVLLVGINASAADEGAARELMTGAEIPAFTARVRHGVMYSRAFGTVPADVGDYADVLTEMRAVAA